MPAVFGQGFPCSRRASSCFHNPVGKLLLFRRLPDQTNLFFYTDISAAVDDIGYGSVGDTGLPFAISLIVGIRRLLPLICFIVHWSCTPR